MKSVVRLEPTNFERALPDALSDALTEKLANKVLKDVGLVVALWDILKIGDSYLFPGDGASHTRVEFRILVFRPFMDEVLVGKIKCCAKEGVHLSLGFFDDILIPPEALQHPYRFDETDQVWVWEYPTEGDDGQAGHHDLFMDPGEEIRFRVTSETFVDTSPTGGNLGENSTTKSIPHLPNQGSSAVSLTSSITTTTNVDNDGTQEEKKVPYYLKASINEPGLGLLTWWNNS